MSDYNNNALNNIVQHNNMKTNEKTNELTLYAKIENQLQERRPQSVFPLTATHRKELRELRDRNVGSLQTRLNFIKSEKREQYVKKYVRDVESELKEKQSVVKEVNARFDAMKEQILHLVETHKQYEADVRKTLGSHDVSHDYCNIGQLDIEDVRRTNRKITINTFKVSNEIVSKEFDAKYNKFFEEATNKITKLNEMYEEAINFGDLEQVKEIYYMFKNADQFLDKVQKIEVQ